MGNWDINHFVRSCNLFIICNSIFSFGLAVAIELFCDLKSQICNAFSFVMIVSSFLHFNDTVLNTLNARLWDYLCGFLNCEQHSEVPWINKFAILSSLTVFCLECRMINQRAARRLIVLHSNKNIELNVKWQTCFGAVPAKCCLSALKQLNMVIVFVTKSCKHITV